MSRQLTAGSAARPATPTMKLAASAACDVPVVMVVFNRPDRAAMALEPMRRAGVRRLLVVADGPRPDHPTDAANCGRSLELFQRLDWDCAVTVEASATNLGCDRRIESGLDWAFGLVDRAIVIEDDIVAHPSFFRWCALMLDRYEHDPDVMTISGRNELVRWGDRGGTESGAADIVRPHFVRLGSRHGWATWAASWHASGEPLVESDAELAARLDAIDIDPIARRHVVANMSLHIAGNRLIGWDTRRSFSQLLRGELTVVPPVNLIANVGFGPGATHTGNADDLRGRLPVPGLTTGELDELDSAYVSPAVDHRLERRRLLIEHMAGYQDVAAIGRLAAVVRRGGAVRTALPPPVLDALSPTRHAAEALVVVDHLATNGVDTVVLEPLRALMSSQLPTVGVVIAVRDAAATVAACLGSVLGQVPPPTEVVVIDGGSLDGTVETVRRIARDAPVLRLIAQHGTGLGAARNEAIAALSTDVVMFCDGDDRWCPDALAVRLDALADPAVGAAIGQVVTVAFDDAGARQHAATLGRARPGWTPGALAVRRSVIDQLGGFDESLRIGGDSSWFVRARQAGVTVAELDDVVLHKGVRADSLSTDVARYRSELLAVARRYIRSTRSARARGTRPPTACLHLLPRFIGGGPERSVVALHRQLAGRHGPVTAMVLDTPMSPSLLAEAHACGIDVIGQPAADAVAEAVSAAEVVVVHYWNHPALARLLHELALPPARVIVWAHVLGTTEPQILPAELARFADGLVLTNPESRRSELGVAATAEGLPIEVVSSPLDETLLAGLHRRVHDGLVVGYLGSFSDAKLHPRAVEVLVAALRAADEAGVDGVRLELVGSGGDPVALRARFAAAGIGDRVVVHGPTTDVAAVLGGFDVFAYPVRVDSYATSDRTVQEAMWSGLPVVMFDGAVARHLLGDADGAGVAVGSEAEFVAAVAELLVDAERRDVLGGRAAASAAARLHPAAAATRFTALVDTLAAGRRRSRRRFADEATSAAELFVATLGERGVRYADDAAVAKQPPIVAATEGGVFHYRNSFPDDPVLDRWARLVVGDAASPDTAVRDRT